MVTMFSVGGRAAPVLKCTDILTGTDIQGFTQSHWMPPLGECLRRIAPAAAMVDEFVETTQNTNKTQL
jgi:hypothetical protein